MAGAAEGYLELPIGVPLGCFTARCKCMGSMAYRDQRQGPYNVGFDESTGIQTRPAVKAIWIDNGDEELVLIKWDACMSNDGLVEAVTKRLEAGTGLDLHGHIVLSASHTHSGYGAYNDQWHWFLGTDRYNEEVFERMADRMAEVALQAWSERQPAKLGLGWDFDWDPTDAVYHDRRGENNDLQVWPDQPDWVGGKDPHLAVLRVDTLDNQPIAVAYVFGMHGILFDADNSLVSTDSIGGLETAVAEDFDRPVVVMHIQGAAGDSSPSSIGPSPYVRMESVGDAGHGGIFDLWSRTPTSSEPITLEVASRHIWQAYDQIKVTRNGTVDWTYDVYHDPDVWHSDDKIYGEDGSILSPLDEFNAPNGAVFCGSDAPLIPGFGLQTEVFPYNTCVRADALTGLIAGTFAFPVEDAVLPFPETYKAGTTAARFGPISVLSEDGQTAQGEFVAGFFPGEPTAMFAEQWRRRAGDELGFAHPLTVGYSQDHEGYLLIPEDWLSGGYEPNINVFGPLQAEHIMEGVLEYGKMLQTDVREDPDPLGFYAPPVYPTHELPTEHPVYKDADGDPIRLFPDPTPEAGTRLTEPPEYLHIPKHFGEDFLDLGPIPAQVSRVDGLVQFAWNGGDPMVDPPHVFLERKNGDTWERALSHSGRPISEAMADILVTYTPFPLYPSSADQTHTYWAVWQAVGHVRDRMSMQTGTYRFHVEGQRYVGDSQTWPWASEPYELTTEAFEVVPATVQIEPAPGGMWVWIDAPGNGFRYLGAGEDAIGRNPLHDHVQLDVIDVDGNPDIVQVQLFDARIDGRRAWVDFDTTGFSEVRVMDQYGNYGLLTL